MITEAELAQLRTNVEAGIRWLDEYNSGARDIVNWNDLNMNCYCVIHQLLANNSYFDAIESIGLSFEDGRNLGFDLPAEVYFNVDLDERVEYWQALTALWQELGPC